MIFSSQLQIVELLRLGTVRSAQLSVGFPWQYGVRLWKRKLSLPATQRFFGNNGLPSVGYCACQRNDEAFFTASERLVVISARGNGAGS